MTELVISYKYNLSLAKHFLNVYQPIKYLVTGAKKKFYLGEKENRKCRFCNGVEPNVSFDNEAHIIPKSLGNLHAISYFECDNCNKIFGDYERDLSKYLGPIRTFATFMGKNRRNPTFEHADGSLKIYRKGNVIIIEGPLHDNTEDKLIKLPFIIEQYIPINVYKALIKMAFSMLDEKEIKLFDDIQEFLLTSKFDNDIRIKSNAFLSSYTTPYEAFEYPIGYLFKKLSTLNNYPAMEYVFVLYFYQCMYQVSLPLNINDKWMYNLEHTIDIITHCVPAMIIDDDRYYFLKDCSKMNPVDLSGTTLNNNNDDLHLTYKGKNDKLDLDYINRFISEK